MISLAEIRHRLEQRPPKLAELGGRMHAAVSLVLCDEGAGPSLLFIERTERDQDPWSGHLGFPGGRVEAEDRGVREAALRETLEETGLDLAGAEDLGRLDDLLGAYVPVVVSCFVFGLRRRPTLNLNPEEVTGAFWFSLEGLLDPRLGRNKVFRFRGKESTHPAIQLLEDGRPYLWGITYRLVSRFLEIVGRPLQPGGSPWGETHPE